MGVFVFYPRILAVVDCVMSEYHFESPETTTIKGKEFLPKIVVSCTCEELKCGAVLITEFTAVMTNVITEEKRLF